MGSNEILIRYNSLLKKNYFLQTLRAIEFLSFTNNAPKTR